MPIRESYAHGVPCWIDLATPDTDAAKAFYAAVFGWTYIDNPTPDGGAYVMAQKDGNEVAGMMKIGDGAGEGAMPPVWSTYISVDDIDATFSKVAPAGGQVMMPPMDVMDHGRMSFVFDPTGAAIGFWQAGAHHGARLINEPGSLCWNELQTPDVPRAAKFYADVLGWGTQSMDMGEGMDYTILTVGEDGIAGAMNPPMEGIPPHWSVIFAVDDADGAVARTTAAKGSILAEPFDIPVGRAAALADPFGAIFQVIKLAEQPPTY